MNKRVLILLFATLLIFNNSTGFDIYAHSFMYYFHNQAAGEFYNFFGIFVLPRYFLLSYIYEFFSSIGVPLGYVVIVLSLYPLNHIIKSIQRLSYHNKISIVHVAFLFASYVLIFFYSGLSLSLLWGLAYFVTNKKIFLIGSLFHPVGIVVFFLLVLFSTAAKFKDLMYAVTLFLVFVIVESHFIGFFTSGKLINSSVYFTDINTILTYSEKIETKLGEMKFLLVLLVIYFIYKKISFTFKIRYKIVTGLLILFSVTIMFYMSSKSTLLYYLFQEQNIDNYSIYSTWFDFGESDLNVTNSKVYSSRYEMNPHLE